jgi:hypothetical protein
MEMEFRPLKMVQDMKVSLFKESDMVKGKLIGLMDQNIVVTG